AILEVVHPDFPSSICGGGRYDDLTGIFGLPNVSGVGISFGADRIYDLLEAKNLFPSSLKESVDLLFLNMGDEEASLALQLSSELMDAGFSCMLYPDNKNFKKQMKYANELGVKKVLIIGTEELTNSEVSIKDMESGEQIRVSQKDLIKTLKS
ncbi:His/Gly/Thr/Pro-type tRNA ligase C-terminal domain-containing protein, partial [Salibacteraceae bacterium]|nr:His/Gly/Thr/Pro-type tRNA ligase C-terminal domain-containing protein [Salibacteraceae bacterium]